MFLYVFDRGKVSASGEGGSAPPSELVCELASLFLERRYFPFFLFFFLCFFGNKVKKGEGAGAVVVASQRHWKNNRERDKK